MPAGRYRDARAFDYALNARIRDIARAHGMDVVRARREIAYDRFLARLQAAAPGEWLLKGGVALDLRFAGGEARRTKDVDLVTSAHDGLAGARRVIHAAIEAKIDDYFAYRITDEPVREIAQGITAYRFKIEVTLDGRRFEAFTCDVGVADKLAQEPDVVQGRSLLAFAGIESPKVLAVPLSRHVAEKLHALSRSYDQERTSSRAKDLVDLALIAAHRDVASAGELAAVIRQVFAERGTLLPASVPQPRVEWEKQYPALADGLAIPQTVDGALRSVRALIDPCLSGDVDEKKCWSSSLQRWEVPGVSELRIEHGRRSGRERELAFDR